jgi:WD40 repeat protein
MDSSSSGSQQLEYKGYMKGHGGWVTAMEVGEVVDGETTTEFLITGSRDKSLMVWDIQEKSDTDADKEWGVPKKIFKGKLVINGDRFHFRSLSLRERPFSLSG